MRPMTRLGQQTIVIAGAGSIGATCALELARLGYAVTVIDPAPLGQNTSGMAAGMLAPTFEAVLDNAGLEVFELYLASMRAWTPLLAALGLAASDAPPSGAVWVGDDPEAMAARFDALGAAHQLVGATGVMAISPGLNLSKPNVLLAPQDCRLDPAATLTALRHAATGLGARFVHGQLTQYADGKAQLADGQVLAADHLVLATGLPRSMAHLAPELVHLSPIKGQLVVFEGAGPYSGPTLRTPLGYATPTAQGLAVGATMEAGRDDLDLDDKVTARLSDLGGYLFPQLAGVIPSARAGVRAASPDRLPLVGPSLVPGVILACGMRRNGWLLAPLVARQVAAYLQSKDQGPLADLLNPQRFDLA